MDILNRRESEVEVGEMIAEVWTYPEEVHSYPGGVSFSRSSEK